jgi:integrase
MKKPRRVRGCIYQRGQTWWVKFSQNGVSHCESSESSDRRVAQRLLDTRLAAVTTGDYAGRTRATVADLWTDMERDYRINGKRSLETVKMRWDGKDGKGGHLKPFLGHLRADQVSSETISRYVDQRQSEGAANGTINRELSALHRMFQLGKQCTPPKVRSIPVMTKLREADARTGFMESYQFEKLIAYCPELWFRAIVEVGRTFGWRRREITCLKVSQIDLAQRTIRLEPGSTKNSEGRMVTMTDALYVLISACVQGKSENDSVFTRPNGSPIKSFRGLWENACKSAGCPGLLFHDLRRTMARNMLRASVPEKVIMQIGGWKTRAVFDRYSIIRQDDIALAMQKFQRADAPEITFSDNPVTIETPATGAPVN